jgi:hypothetical protein
MSLQSEGIILTEDHIKDIYEKLNAVEQNVGGVRSSISELHVVLKHVSGDFDRMEEVLESLEKMLYGKGGDATNIGLMTRIIHLEHLEEKRQAAINWIWVVIGGLIVEGIIRFFQFYAAGNN